MSPSEYFATTSTFKVGGTVPYFSPLQLQAYIDFISGKNPEGKVRHNPVKSDVFSLGLTFIHMASLRIPTGLNDLKGNIVETISKSINELSYSQVIKNLLTNMLEVEETRRPTFTELKRRLG